MMRWIYLSPHLDDAIFSMGGTIYDQVQSGASVEVWTVNTRPPKTSDVSPLAQKIHEGWGFHTATEVVPSRREENRRACAVVGARDVYLDFLDCIYRQGPNGNWLYEVNTFSSPHAIDQELVVQLSAALASRIEPDDKIVCPLAIGGHVDHVLTRQAAENLTRTLWYYADIPYLFAAPSSLDVTRNTMPPQRQHISWKGLIAWQNSAAEYTSQIPMEFENPRQLRFSIAKYWWKGVYFWKTHS